MIAEMRKMISFCRKERGNRQCKSLSLKTVFRETYLPPKKKKKPQTLTFIFHSSRCLFENYSYFKPSTTAVMSNFHQALGHTVSSLKAGASRLLFRLEKIILFTKSLRMLLKKDYIQFIYSLCFIEAQFPCLPRINRSLLGRVFRDLKTNSKHIIYCCQ